MQGRIDRIWADAKDGSFLQPSSFYHATLKIKYWICDIAPLIEFLPSMHKAMSSIPQYHISQVDAIHLYSEGRGSGVLGHPPLLSKFKVPRNISPG